MLASIINGWMVKGRMLTKFVAGEDTLPSFWRVRTTCRPPPATVNIPSMMPRGRIALMDYVSIIGNDI